MNARLYDPVIHRFLQVDNYIQDPANTQNYNQYGYVLNNPLIYIDPSGNMAQGSGPGKDCVDCGWGAAIGSALSTIGQNWDNWRIKDWANKNISLRKWGVSEWGDKNLNLKNWGKSISKWFGGGDGPPPNLSSYVNLGDSQTNNYLATGGSLISGASGVMNELSIVKFHNAAPTGYYAVNYNGTLRYWSDAFKGGTRAGISYMSVQAAKASSNSLKFISKIAKSDAVGFLGNNIGYYSAVENLANRDYYGAVREAAANRYSIRLANTRGGIWAIGWTIMGPWITNTELYNRIFFGKNSAVYQDRERENGWYESKILND